MRDRNIAFDEAFKRLDNLCKDMYDAPKGVTSYIDHMKSVSPMESSRIAGWNIILRRLQELRHSRNQLAHQSGTWDAEMCTEADIEWLEDFYRCILDGTDPVARLGRYRRQRTPHYYEPHKNNYRNAAITVRLVLLFSLLAIGFVWALIGLFSSLG